MKLTSPGVPLVLSSKKIYEPHIHCVKFSLVRIHKLCSATFFINSLTNNKEPKKETQAIKLAR